MRIKKEERNKSVKKRPTFSGRDKIGISTSKFPVAGLMFMELAWFILKP